MVSRIYSSQLAKQQSLASVLPVIVYSYGSEFFGEQVMLMEDITTRGATPVNFIHGNQVRCLLQHALLSLIHLPSYHNVVK
jgi:hypothetical protein